MKQLTWFEASKLPAGTRVVFADDHDIYPEALVPAGTMATVTTNDLNEMSASLYVLPDDASLRDALKEWDGEIILYPALDRDESGNKEFAWNALSPISA